MSAAQRARLDAATGKEYATMDNAAFDRRTKALEYLDAREVLGASGDQDCDQASKSEWCARAELYAAFEDAGFDRELLRRLGLRL